MTTACTRGGCNPPPPAPTIDASVQQKIQHLARWVEADTSVALFLDLPRLQANQATFATVRPLLPAGLRQLLATEATKDIGLLLSLASLRHDNQALVYDHPFILIQTIGESQPVVERILMGTQHEGIVWRSEMFENLPMHFAAAESLYLGSIAPGIIALGSPEGMQRALARRNAPAPETVSTLLPPHNDAALWGWIYINDTLRGLLPPMLQTTTAVNLGLQVAATLQGIVQLHHASATEAQATQQILEGFVALLSTEGARQPELTPLLRSITVTHTSNVVTLQAALTPQELQQLLEKMHAP